MVWSSTKIKIGWGVFCYGLIAIIACIMLAHGEFSINALLPAIPIALLGLLALFPSEQQAKAGITKETLISEFGLKNIISEQGVICESKIINDNLEFELLDSDGGYTNKTIRNMLKKHQLEVQGKSVVIRVETPNLNRGTAFNNFGLYVETGKVVK